MDNLLADAITLTFFGMGFVFLFLTLMVVLTSMMSALVQKIQPNLAGARVAPIQSVNVLDEDTKSIIEKAIKMHTGA
jgi:oxaloacetate decarboxylase gamma subunit|tara:strand:- start:154 stop:384 length:231 start_codon:yes stop_codon:yes gene_type:complete